jgi:hypothetical protein
MPVEERESLEDGPSHNQSLQAASKTLNVKQKAMIHESMGLKNNFAVLHRNIELQGLPELARTQSEQVAKPIQLFSRT